MDKLQYTKFLDVYEKAKADWEAIYFEDESSELEGLEHWAAFHGLKLLAAFCEILQINKLTITATSVPLIMTHPEAFTVE